MGWYQYKENYSNATCQELFAVVMISYIEAYS